MADVFISYAHEDEQLVERLRAALERRGREVWSDTQIEPADRWKVAAHDAIERSDAVLFVVSVASLASDPCRLELAHATGLHKRLIVVAVDDAAADVADKPESIGELSWIMLRPGDDFERAVDRVVHALDVDLEVVREHTRILVRARAWELGQRRASPLLRGDELRTAEDWLSGAAAAGSPATDLQRDFIRASRNAATRRQRAIVAISAAVAAVAIGLSIFAFIQRDAARHATKVARSQADAAKAAVALGSDPQRSLRLALESTELDASGGAEQALRLALVQSHMRIAIRSGGRPRSSPIGSPFGVLAAWDPGSSRLAVTGPRGSIQIWNARTGRLQQTLASSSASPVFELVYDRRGDRLAAISTTARVTVWKLSRDGTASPVSTTALNADVRAALTTKTLVPGTVGIAWSGSPQHLLVAGTLLGTVDNVLAFDPATRAVTRLFRNSNASGYTLVPSPDGSRALANLDFVVTSGAAGFVTLTPPKGVHRDDDGPSCWLPGGKSVVTSTSIDAGGPVQVWDAASGRLTGSFQIPDPPLNALTCSASSTDPWVAAGDADGNVRLRLASGQTVPLEGDTDTINAIASSPDGRYLATASQDGNARVWDAATGKAATVLAGDGSPLEDVAFGDGDGLLLTVDAAGVTRVWDSGLGRPQTRLQAPPGGGESFPLGFAAAGREVVGVAVEFGPKPATLDHVPIASATAVVWNAGSGRIARSFRVRPAPLPCSGQSILAGADFYVANGCALPPPPPLALAVPAPKNVFIGIALLGIALSPDGSLLAYAGAHGVAVVDLRGRPVARLALPRAPTGVAFAGPPGDRVIATTAQGVYLWRPRPHTAPLLVRTGHAPVDASLSADGNRLVTVDMAGTVDVWDASTGRLFRALRVPAADRKPSDSYYTSRPLRAALNRDGTVAGAGTASGMVVIWDVRSGRAIAARSVSGWPTIAFSATADGTRFLAVNYPQAGSGGNPPGAAAVFDANSGAVVASYQAAAPLVAPIVPGAALDRDGGLLLTGVLGLAPAAGAAEAVLDVSDGQPALDLRDVRLSSASAYSTFPVAPWGPAGTELLAGDDAVYRCDACAPLGEMQRVAATRLAWSRPLTPARPRPPAGDPYR